jgi:hypothetical protein
MPANVKKARQRGQAKAAAKVHVSTMADEPIGPGNNWKAEQKKRLEGQIKALEKELKEFNPQAAAEKVRASLDLELRRTKLRLEQNALEDL